MSNGMRKGAEFGRRLIDWLLADRRRLRQAAIARHAWRVSGGGVHAARVNYGECFAYALAKETGEPLRFKGNEFARIDVEPALKD